MIRILLIMIIISSIFIVGCTPNYQLHTFENHNNSIKNEQECFDFCMERQRDRLGYHCEYKPVNCEGDVCLCTTY